MKKKLSILLALILLLGLLCGCGAKSESADYAPAAADMVAYSTAYSNGYAETESYYGGWNEAKTVAAEAPMEPAAPDLPSLQSGSKLPANVKLIYRADVSLESTEFDVTVAGLNALVDSLGGYYERSELDNSNNRYRRGYYTVRVPAAGFDAFCEGVGGLCQVNSISRSAEDVSEAYYDIESRLTTQKTKLERLQALLKKADVMEDIIKLESAISDTELTIEQLTGSLRKYDSLVGYSTINVSLFEVYKLTEPEAPAIGFGAKLAAAFKSGTRNFVDGLGDFIIDFARGWVGWLIFIAVVAVIVLLIRRAVRRGRARRGEKAERRRRGKKNAPASPAIPQPEDEKKE